jgi:hypothetical protein
MSSARSNASARQRRSGGDIPRQQYPPQNTHIQQSQQSAQQPQQNPKLSISDAIALITLRLGRVENIVQNLPTDMTINTEQNNGLVKNIMERLNTLETQPTPQSSNISKEENDIVINNIANRITQLESKSNNNGIIKNMMDRLNALESRPVNTTSVKTTDTNELNTTQLDIDNTKSKEDIVDLKIEISKLKDSLISLQTFTMTTNKQLSDLILFDNNQQSDVITPETMEILRQNICDNDNISLDVNDINDINSDNNDIKKTNSSSFTSIQLNDSENASLDVIVDTVHNINDSDSDSEIEIEVESNNNIINDQESNSINNDDVNLENTSNVDLEKDSIIESSTINDETTEIKETSDDKEEKTLERPDTLCRNWSKSKKGRKK